MPSRKAKAAGLTVVEQVKPEVSQVEELTRKLNQANRELRTSNARIQDLEYNNKNLEYRNTNLLKDVDTVNKKNKDLLAELALNAERLDLAYSLLTPLTKALAPNQKQKTQSQDEFIREVFGYNPGYHSVNFR